MSIVVRPLRPDEGRLFLQIYRSAVHGLARDHYPASVLNAWAPRPVTDAAVEIFCANSLGEIRIIAELEGELAGIGVITPSSSELTACYVAPDAARQGVGSAIVSELERIAREHGLPRLYLVASLTAEPFCAALGYQELGRGEPTLRSGTRMACVTMEKAL